VTTKYLAKFQSSTAVSWPKIIEPERISKLIYNLCLYTQVRHHFFFAMLGDIGLIFGIWVYNDELQIKFTFRLSPMILAELWPLELWNLAKYLVVTTKYLAKIQSPRTITQPKIIGPERNVSLICNSSLYTHIPKIKSISPSIAKKSCHNCFISELRTWITLYVPAT
jgi:hypothetical protein